MVSILIPAYNAEKWISQTIQSAVNQTWPKKEIIIVDDGSTDKTLQVALRFESKIVKVVSQENKGASAARNKTLSLAQGEYIQWLDADDLLALEKISLQMAAAQDCAPNVLLSGSFGTFFYRQNKAIFEPTSLWKDMTPIEFLTAKFSENVWMNPAVWLVSRHITDFAGPWNQRLSLDDDGEYFSRVVSVSDRIKFVPEAKMFYRQCNIGSLSKNNSYKACASLLLSLNLCIEYLRSLEDSDRARNACLKHLKTWYSYFYPEMTDFVNEMNKMAAELGGSLSPPELSWKYSIIRKIFGWHVAKQFRYRSRKIKLSAYINVDKLMYKLSSSISSR